MTRRDFLRNGLRIAAGASVTAIGGLAGRKLVSADTVWQIDPEVCVQCGNCRTECVLTPSAVKCVHAYAVCGYCDECSGYLQPWASSGSTAAETRLCPTNAIKRTFVEDPYYEYIIQEDLCIACGKCVKGCSTFGNGSLFLQIRHNLCVNCNAGSIDRHCPSGAVKRVSAQTPYLLKGRQNG